MSKAKKLLKKKDKGKDKKKSSLRQETKRSILAIVFFVLAVLSFFSFFNQAGLFGQYFLMAGQWLFGFGFFLVSLAFILIGLSILFPRFRGGERPVYRAIFIGSLLFILSILGLFHIFSAGAGSGFLPAAGGYIGLLVGYPLLKFLNIWASLVVLFALVIISVLITFNISLKIPSKKDKEDPLMQEKSSLPGEKKKGLFSRFKSKIREEIERGKDKKLKKSHQEQLTGRPAQENDILIGHEKKVVAAVSSSRVKTGRGDKSLVAGQIKKTDKNFKLPSVEFLEKDKGQPTSGDIKANINIIKRTLENFGIEVEMAEVNVGPTVTQYTLRPAQGVKLAKITSLHNDLALALAAHPLRIEAPIPGRSLVGVEIPNRSMVSVRLGSLLERPTFKESPSPLTFALGRDVAGGPMYADLCQMPHLLVAGATGTGKTIALNNILLSLFYRNTPDDLKIIMIDPKRVEFTLYNSVPHLLSPVIVEPDKAIGALRWAISEMEERFGILQEAGKRDIAGYNKGASDEQRLPYVVIVIDELADLMSSQGREVEAAIIRLAQMARAVGIHLIVSTQRPSVEVITGLIKANITSRMAFQVASQIDSRTILDMAGAEKLLGNGDMLFLAGNSAKPRRLQGAYVSEKEVKKTVEYLKELGEPDYNEEVASAQLARADSVSSLDFSSAGDSDDDLADEAKKVVFQAGKASASLLQRRLRIGYARAARLLDILEKKGVVGPADGAKPRDVYVDQGEEREF